MKNQKRVVFVICILFIFSLWLYITVRGDYLQILGIGEEYKEIFKYNLKQKSIVFVISFSIVFLTTYISTVLIKKGLKKFFDEEKKEAPKLPNKSISLLFGLIGGIFFTRTITEKAILAINNAWFAKADPIFHLDIGYFVFQKPFIETTIIYIVGLFAVLSLYIAAYYIIVFNKYLNEGINMETLKKNTFIKQLIINICIIVVLISIYNIIKVQNTVFDKFLTLDTGVSINGARISRCYY